MPPFDSVMAVFIAGVFLSAAPGPSMLYVLSRSIGQSRSAGLASAFGLCLGGIILAVATAMGLAKLFAEFPALVVVLRYVGSIYLIWLGGTMILHARTDAQAELKVAQVIQRSFSSIIWQGVLVELLNPKTVLFFALFLPPFVVLGDGQGSDMDVMMQLLVLGILIPLAAIPADVLVAFMGGNLARSINRRQDFRKKLGRIGGVTLIVIALNLHLGFL
ncbi:MAG: threonine/homoserine/homoserine lactone efflux protein [Reinekea sp.]|jgi:threonine/homoserine/homoserine lactone efflux protein